MPQKFINNFDVLTAFAIGAGGELVIGDLLSGAPLARINALLALPGDWVELALIAEDGQTENIRVDSELQRDNTGNGSGALAWPAGSRVIAPFTAEAASAAKAALRPFIDATGDTLQLSPVGAWLWVPNFIAPLVIENDRVYEELAGDFVMPAAVVLMDTYGSDDPVAINILTAPAFAKLPAGVSGVYNAEMGSYQITLPPAKNYMLRFSGVASVSTLDVSNYSEYTAVA